MKPGFMSMFSKSKVVQCWPMLKISQLNLKLICRIGTHAKYFFFSDLIISSVPLLCRSLVIKGTSLTKLQKEPLPPENNDEHLHKTVTSTFV